MKNISTLLQQLPAIVLKIDGTGKIIDVWTERDTLEFPEIKSKQISEVFPDDIAKEIISVSQKALSTSKLEKIYLNFPSSSLYTFTSGYILPESKNSCLVFLQNTTLNKEEEKLTQKHKEIMREHAQLLSIFDSIDHIISVTDMDTYEILYVNRALQNRYKYPLVGRKCYKEFQNLDSPCPFCTNSIIKNNNYQPYYWEFYNKLLKGYFHITDRVIKWPDGRDVRFELAVDITKQKNLEKELKLLAATDELTGVWNRRHFIHQGNHEFERALRYNINFSLILMDVDWFKKINDNYGHPAGDMILKKLSEIITKNLRGLDICARIDGDEFGIILPSTDIQGALKLAERLRISISKRSFKYDNTRFKITVSVGITEYTKELSSFEEMFKRADTALYQAKQKGRNCTVSKVL